MIWSRLDWSIIRGTETGLCLVSPMSFFVTSCERPSKVVELRIEIVIASRTGADGSRADANCMLVSNKNSHLSFRISRSFRTSYASAIDRLMSRFARIKGPRPLYICAAAGAGVAAYRLLKPESLNASLNAHDFAPYILVDKQSVSSTNAIFSLHDGFGVPEPDSIKEARKRGVWSVQAKQPQLQIARAYTPLPSNPDEGDDEDGHSLRFLIRQETGGEMSTYLHRLPAGSTIELRGPTVEYELPQDVKEVLFLAGGTGIAPAMQVAEALSRLPGSKMHLLWANRRREECEGGFGDQALPDPTAQASWWKSLLGLGKDSKQAAPMGAQKIARKGLIVRELEALQERGQAATGGLDVQYYVDEERLFIQPGDVTKRIHSEPHEGPGSRLILISGPDGFVEYWAGKKLWVEGREVQGPLRGVLGKMDLKNWQVVKL